MHRSKHSLFYHLVGVGEQQTLLPEERPHFLQEAGKGRFIFKDEMIAAR